MKNSCKGFVLGFALALGLVALTAGALSTARTAQAELTYRDIVIQVDGAALSPTDAEGTPVEPFLLDGTTYLPVRAVAQAVGMEVAWDEQTSTVLLTSPKKQNVSALDTTHVPVSMDGADGQTADYQTTGTGDRTLAALHFSTPRAVHVTSSGAESFSLAAVNEDTGSTLTLVSNARGPYDGTVLLPTAGSWSFVIQAGGDWTLSAAALTETALTGFYGSGDAVTGLVPDPAANWTLTYNGTGRFCVTQWSAAGSASRVLADQTGPCSLTIASDLTGSVFFEIRADGPWSITGG